MNFEQYQNYLAMFNATDYDGVISHFTDDCEIEFGGYALVGHQAVRDFYAFFHAHVEERIEVTRYVSDSWTIAMEAIVRLTGKGGGTQAMLEERGLGRLAFPEKGEVIEMPQFIHYHLQDGKFRRALCAICPPADVRLQRV